MLVGDAGMFRGGYFLCAKWCKKYVACAKRLVLLKFSEKKTQTWYPNDRAVWRLKDVFPVQKRTGEMLGSM